MSPKMSLSNCCFFSQNSSQVVASVGVASDRVYLSDGYPQATAHWGVPSTLLGVYLSDGYPQATAAPRNRTSPP